MQSLLITHKGAEEVAQKEIKEILGFDSEAKEAAVIFSPAELKDLCRLCYKTQSAIKVMYLLCSGNFKELDHILEAIKKIDEKQIKAWTDEKTFAVRCMHDEECIFSSQEIEEKVGGYIYEYVKAKVNLDNPDVTFFVFINKDRFYFGIDFAGFDMSKRSYRMFHHIHALRGTVAYALLRMAEFQKGESVLDPFAGSGTISIEAALFSSGLSVNYYNKERFAFRRFNQFKEMDFDAFFEALDKSEKIKEKARVFCFDNTQRNVKSSEKNAKIAGANKYIDFSRQEIENLDIKFEEKSLDCIATNPPEVSKRLKKSVVKKLLDELFYNSKYILKEDGMIAMISRDLELVDDAMKKHEFKLVERKDIWQGKERLVVNLIKKFK